eukprot:1084758-Rhodomonas_salina.1
MMITQWHDDDVIMITMTRTQPEARIQSWHLLRHHDDSELGPIMIMAYNPYSIIRNRNKRNQRPKLG